MKQNLLALIALSGLALSAQDRAVTLLYTMAKPSDYTRSSTATHVETDTFKGLGLRYSQAAGQAFGARLALEATWKLRNKGGDLKVDGVPYSTPSTTLEIRHESLGAGLSFTWTKAVDFGFALDLRNESTSLHVKDNASGAQYDLDQTVVRPWLGLRVGYTVPTGAVKPTFGLEYGLPLTKREGGEMLGLEDVTRKLRPKNELSLTAGIRF